MEGFRIQTTQELKPWQEPKYLSLDAILEHIGDERGLKYHYSEKEKIAELKKNLK
jgi:two-component SAPR family response regulator